MYAHYLYGDEELYDLRRDPFELVNRAEDARYDSIRKAFFRRTRTLARCRGASCRSRPRLRLVLRAAGRRKPRRSCVSTALRVRVVGRDAPTLARVEVFVGARRAARLRRKPFLRVVPRRRFRIGGPTLLRVLATTRDGRVVTLDRHLQSCG
jgi:hypothetical protein